MIKIITPILLIVFLIFLNFDFFEDNKNIQENQEINRIELLEENFTTQEVSNTILEENWGDNLVMASIGEPSNLIPILATDSASHEISSFLYISPLKYNKDLEIVPYAAKSFEVLDNGKHLKFTLHEDLLWQDGTPLTADDVTFTYNLIINPNTPTAYAADFQSIKEYKQTGKYTFEVFYDEVYARSLISWMRDILPKHILENEDITRTDFARNPIGAGPFKLKEWQAGSRLILEANPHYFEGRPALNNIVYRIIPDTSTIFLEARNNAVDFLSLTPQQYLRQTNGAQWEEKWNKYKYLSFGYTYFGFNLKSPLFEDKKVRQALSYAIDREAIISSVLLGLGEATVGPYKPETWAYNHNLKAYEFDKERAQTLLKEAGWLSNKNGILEKDGRIFSFTVLTNQGNDLRIKTATIMQAYYKEIGIDMKIRTVEWSAFIKEFVDTGNFDALILSWNILQDPDIFDVWHSSKTHEGGLNFVKFMNEEVDELLVSARSTVDQEKRQKDYYRFQEILHEEQPYLFLYVPYSLPMIQKRFHNVHPSPSGITYNIDKWYVPKDLQLHK